LPQADLQREQNHPLNDLQLEFIQSLESATGLDLKDKLESLTQLEYSECIRPLLRDYLLSVDDETPLLVGDDLDAIVQHAKKLAVDLEK